jgi:hypothetical protein
LEFIVARPTLITVSGQLLKVDGTPEIGTITFQAGVYALYSHDSIAQVPSRMSVALDANGIFEIEVPATDDPDWAPVDWTYQLIIRLNNDYSIYEVSIPYDSPGGELSLAELIPTSNGSGPINPGNYAPLVHMHSGEQITTGTINVARLPVGTTAGTVAAGDDPRFSGSGGSAGDPATTVVTETSYGQSSAVGVSTLYARGDHSHGTPALPTPGAIGAATASHNHSATDINSGTLNIARIPTGTSGTTVALGNDSRFTDSRTPTAHAASHASAGSDPITVAQSQVTNLVTDLAAKAPLASPTFTGTVGGVTKAMVGLGNVDNTSDANKPVSTATQTALDGKAASSHTHAQSDVTGLTAALSGKANTADLADVALSGSYDDLTDKPTIPTVPVTSVAGRTGDVTLTKSDVGLADVDNTTDANKPISSATQTALDLKAPLASPTFTGTVAGITKAMVGLGSVDNTADSAKPVSTAQQTALDLKANLASPTFTGTVSGITKAMVGLANVDNTADSAKPVSTAQQTALNLKANLASPTFTGTVAGITKAMVGLGNVDNTSDATKDAATATLTNKTLSSPAFTGTPTGLTKSHVGLANVDNTADSAKPVSTAQQTALDGKPDVYAWNGSAYVLVTTGDIYIGPGDPGSIGNGSIWIDTDA